MGAFITGTELKTIHADWWEDFETVTIREYNQLQKDTIEKENTEIEGVADAPLKMRLQSALIPVMVAGIESWTLTMNGKKDGPVAPVNREWIGKLAPVDYSLFIVTEIRELNKGRSDAARRQFLREPGEQAEGQEETATGDNAD